MARELHVNLNVELDNSFTLQPLSSVSIAQRIDGHHTFEIRTSLEAVEGREEGTLNKSQNFIGKNVKIEFKDQQGTKQHNLFNGVVTDIGLVRHSGAAADVVFKGYSPTILLENGPHCAMYSEKTIKQIVQGISTTVPVNLLKSKLDPSPDMMIPWVVQYNESHYNFIGRLANLYGQWFYYDGREMYFGKATGGEPIQMIFGHDLSKFDISMRLTPLKFEAYSYNYVTNEKLKDSSGGKTIGGTDSWSKKAIETSESFYSTLQTFHTRESLQDASEIGNLVMNRKSALAGDLVLFAGVSDNPQLFPGCKIKIEGASNASLSKDSTDYGQYVVTSVTHNSDGRGGYQNQFEAIVSKLKVPPYNSRIKEPNCEAQTALVTDNKDPEGYGRLKVKFFWQKDADTTAWVRYAVPHAGKDRGNYFLPEVGDEVLVSFEGGNPSKPVIVGSLYHGKANSADKKENDNFTKSIRTVSGNEILFSDKGSEESIHIFTKDKKNEILITAKADGLIQITSNKNITVEAKEGIEVKSKTMKFTAQESIEFSAKEFKVKAQTLIQLESTKDLKQKGLDVTVEASKDLKLSATMNAELKATMNMDLAGLKTTVKANTQLELSGTAMATLKAAMVMIN